MSVAAPSRSKKQAHTGFLAFLLSLSVIGVAGAVAVSIDNPAADAGTSVAPQALQRTYVSHPSMVVYLVDSQEMADRAWDGEREAAIDRESNGIQDPGYQFIVLKAATPEEARDADEVLQNLLANSPNNLSIVDLRD